jgi:hypothetical protein
MVSRLLDVVRDEVLAALYPEIKDPDLVRLPESG